MTISEKQQTAETWFRSLRDDICARFEAIEHDMGSSAMFARKAWNRPEGGGGEMSVMKGSVFEKVGVNISTVHGEFSEPFRKEIPGAADNPRFWASGISLVAHPMSPHVPAAHMNTRMIVIGGGEDRLRSPKGEPEGGGAVAGANAPPGASAPSRIWFGGGGDLTPTFPDPRDTQDFHDAFKTICDPTSPAFYPAFAAWCEEYFFLPHRNETRGVGGIFYDYLGLNTLGTDTTAIAPGQFGKGGLGKERTARGMETAANAPLDWDQCFTFTRNVGMAFADIYSALVRRHMAQPWTEAERTAQLKKRGRYAEYNLLYDRGTRFGLMTGGHTEAILMSLPPHAIWD